MLVNSWPFQENNGKLMMIYQKHIHVRELYESNLSVNSFFLLRKQFLPCSLKQQVNLYFTIDC